MGVLTYSLKKVYIDLFVCFLKVVPRFEEESKTMGYAVRLQRRDLGRFLEQIPESHWSN